MTDAEELYGREAHRKRALEMYQTIGAATISPDNSSLVSPENSSVPGAALDKSQSGGSRFSQIMETFQLFQPTPHEVKKEDEPKESPDEAKQKHTIAVSGNYIPPPSDRLGFARRTGMFHPTSAMEVPERTTVSAEEMTLPHLRILKDGEQSSSNF